LNESVNSFSHLYGLIEIVEVTRVRDPFQSYIGTFRRHIRKDGWGLGRVSVSLQLKHRKRKIVFAYFTNGSVELRGHITKQGNRSVRKWLMESSWVAIRHDPVLLDKFRRVLSHCGSKKKAIVAVARKLALRLRRLLLSGEPYVVGVLE
jgi:hypothetical protein